MMHKHQPKLFPGNKISADDSAAAIPAVASLPGKKKKSYQKRISLTVAAYMQLCMAWKKIKSWGKPMKSIMSLWVAVELSATIGCLWAASLLF